MSHWFEDFTPARGNLPARAWGGSDAPTQSRKGGGRLLANLIIICAGVNPLQTT